MNKDEINLDQETSYIQMEHNDNTYRFVPQSNYWICVKSEDWTQRWVICSDEFGLELTKEAESRGFNISQLLIDNKCSKRRMNVKIKKETKSESFLSLFDEESEEPSEDDFISLF